jgi:glycosyltransferase involved in cell wall biosynthesis
VLALVSGQKWLGGLTIQTALLCRELERLGHQVAVVSIGAPAVVDLFPHAPVRYGSPGNGGADGLTKQGEVTNGYADPASDYIFHYEVVADAARYLPPGPPALRTALAPLARAGMAIVAPPAQVGRAPLTQARGTAAAFARGMAAALDAGLSGGAAEAPFLARLLLHTDQRDLQRLNEIREWFNPDVDYACDLALVPMMAKLEDRGIPLVAAAQGFELVRRRGVGLVQALRDVRHRLDLVLSGSEANIDENLMQLPAEFTRDVPARAIPYGVALDAGWEMPRQDAIQRMRGLERVLSMEQRGAGGLWGDGATGGQAPFIITSLSRIDVEKGTDLVLHALAVLRQSGVPARLWIAGNVMPGSAYLEVLRQKIRLMDLADCVSLIGTLNDPLDKVAVLRASDAFAAGFIRSEPFGLVYTEAFAAELAVVAPAMGAGPELMCAMGDTTTLYSPNDTGSLAARLLDLYEQPELRRRVASLGRRAFEERFNATQMAAAAAREFQRAVADRGGRLHAAGGRRSA